MSIATQHNLLKKIIVTGACGNLGRKVIEALVRTGECQQLIGIDLRTDYSLFSETAWDRLRLVDADLAQRDGEWSQTLAGANAVLHFAALNPAPDASWEESMVSYDMTLNLLTACVQAGVSRFVFASSNHVMGAYKDLPLAAKMGTGLLRTDLPVAPGTKWHDGARQVHSMAYGSAKAMCEKLCASMTALSGGRLSTVCVRIGCTLPGDNRPQDIKNFFTFPPELADTDDETRRTFRWFHNMWLSNGDFEQLFIRATATPSDAWSSQALIVNGVSHNRDMDWDLSSASRYLGYQAKDDVYAHVPRP